MNDLGAGGGVDEAGPTEGFFDLWIEQPCGSDEPPCDEPMCREGGDPLVGEVKGRLSVEREELGLARRVDLFVEPCSQAALSGEFGFALREFVSPAVEDDLVALLLPLAQPADKGGVLVEAALVLVSGDDKQAQALHPKADHLVHLAAHRVKVEWRDVVDRNDEVALSHDSDSPALGNAGQDFLRTVLNGEGRDVSPSFCMNGTKKRILIVDDEPDVLQVMLEALRAVPEYEVQAVSNPQQAYQIANVRPPDLLIADYNMPLLRGDQLFLCLGVDPNDAAKCAPRPKLLLISGAISDAEVHHLAEFVNGTAAMAKPFSVQELRKKVAELLADSPSLA